MTERRGDKRNESVCGFEGRGEGECEGKGVGECEARGGKWVSEGREWVGKCEGRGVSECEEGVGGMRGSGWV